MESEASSSLSRVPCLVCNHPQGSAHFGSTSCLACAAFFRRAVALDIEYVCKKDRRCAVFHELRMMCRGCRFDKCISAGMQAHYVQKRRSTRRDGRDISQREETVIKATIDENCYKSMDSPTFQPQCAEYTLLSPIPMLSEPTLTFEAPASVESCMASGTSTEPVSPNLPMLNISGPELLQHYVKELRRAMDRRCVMFTSCPMRVVTNSYGDVPFKIDMSKPHTMKDQRDSQRFDHLLAFEYCQAMPGFDILTTNEKLIFFRLATMSFCLLDIAWITAKTTTSNDDLVLFTDGTVSSVSDSRIGWDDEDGISAAEKRRLFADFLSRFHSALIRPFIDYKLDRVEYAALKAFCVWKLGYFEYTQKMRALAKEQETGLLIGLDAYYENRPDKAERLGNIILLMGTIFEMYHSIQETYQGIELFQLFKMDTISSQLLTNWVQPK